MWVYKQCMYGILAFETCMGCNGDDHKSGERGGSMIEGLEVGSGLFFLKGGGFIFSFLRGFCLLSFIFFFVTVSSLFLK